MGQQSWGSNDRGTWISNRDEEQGRGSREGNRDGAGMEMRGYRGRDGAAELGEQRQGNMDKQQG